MLFNKYIENITNNTVSISRFIRWNLTEVASLMVPPSEEPMEGAKKLTNGVSLRILLFVTFLIVLFIVSCADYNYGDPVQPSPPEAVKVAIANITDTSVTISWTKCVNDSFKGYVILSNEGEYINSKVTPKDTLLYAIDTIYTLKGLQAQVYYSFRVTVLLKNGVSTPSPYVSAKTLESLKGILKLYHSIVNSDIYFTWTQSVPLCSRYKLFSDSLVSVNDSSKITVVTQSSQSDTSYIYKNQSPGSSMFYRVYSYNDSGKVVSKSGPVKVELLNP